MLYRTYGLKVSAAHPGETAHLQRQASIGAAWWSAPTSSCRPSASVSRQQGEGLSAADKARRLDELRRAILRTAAKRELAVREIEGAEFMPRAIHPELAIYKQAAVERLAAR